MDYPPGPKKVAVVERWPLVEARLYENRVQERAPLQNTLGHKFRNFI